MIDQYDPYIELASKIVLHNIDDYIAAAQRYHRDRDYKDLKIMNDLQEWFYSDRFKLYCKIHPDRIMKHIREEVKKINGGAK